MELAFRFLALAIVHTLSLISPGPDFVLVTRNSVLFSSRIGVWTALGVTSGNAIHILYAVFLTSLLGAQNERVLHILQLLGALYLAWLGVRCLISKPKELYTDEAQRKYGRITHWGAFRSGFLSTLLNAKAAIYFMSVSLQFIMPSQSMLLNAAFFMEFILISGIWFVSLALSSGSRVLKQMLHSNLLLIDRAMGIALLVFAIFMMREFILGIV
ncbi:MAG: LysE family translocator [Bdellovibrionota bacterium]